FVRNNYPKWVRWMRANKVKKSTALLVHIDADSGSVLDELRLLENALKNAGIDHRAADEPIAIAIPKRNIETWIHGLCNVTVDEVYDFKRDPEGRISSVTQMLTRLTDARIKPA